MCCSEVECGHLRKGGGLFIIVPPFKEVIIQSKLVIVNTLDHVEGTLEPIWNPKRLRQIALMLYQIRGRNINPSNFLKVPLEKLFLGSQIILLNFSKFGSKYFTFI